MRQSMIDRGIATWKPAHWVVSFCLSLCVAVNATLATGAAVESKAKPPEKKRQPSGPQTQSRTKSSSLIRAKPTVSKTQKTVTATSGRGKGGRKIGRSKKTAKRRLVRGQQEIESSRVLEIQKALATVGYYKEQPSGKWDTATTQAMSAYQDANGFKITGKPDALSLKKLGL